MTSVFIIDDHALIIEGLLGMLQNEPSITIAGYATDAEACIHFFKTKTADVILMDINLPNMSGIDLCKYIKENYSKPKVIALSSYHEGSYVNKMMEHGASGYLLKNAEKIEILEAISTVMIGKEYMSFEAGKNYHAIKNKLLDAPLLTKREKEILKLIAEGLTNTQISQQLFISVDTVDTHRKNLYTKLGVKNTALLIRYAIENSMLD